MQEFFRECSEPAIGSLGLAFPEAEKIERSESFFAPGPSGL